MESSSISHSTNMHSTSLLFATPSDKYSHFYGYYDTSPLDISGTRLLTHRVAFDERNIKADDKATIGFWDTNSGKFHQLGTTSAFNWQEGSRLQWMPPDYSSRIIYNDRRDGQYVAVIIDIQTGTERILPHPIYALHPSGQFALSPNFERLYFCRKGYHYEGIVNQKWDVPIHDEDGIFRIDINTGSCELLIQTRQVVDYSTLANMMTGYNWLSHIQWNPSGTRFAFLHRWHDDTQWISENDISGSTNTTTTEKPYATRLFTSNADGTDLFMFPDSKFYSHMGWRSDNEFTIWGKKKDNSQNKFVQAHRRGALKKSGLMTAVVNLYRYLKSHFSILNVASHIFTDTGSYLYVKDRTSYLTTMQHPLLSEDGHNSWQRNGRYMITDTYPDDNSYQHLYLYNIEDNILSCLGSFYSPFRLGTRCDLHPRWDYSGSKIIIDSAHQDGKRQVYVFALDNLT